MRRADSRARGRNVDNQISSIRIESSSPLLAHVLAEPSALRELDHGRRLEDLREGRVGSKQVVLDHSLRLAVEPAADGVAEEPDLLLLDDPTRNQVASCDTQQMLPRQPFHLEAVRHRCAELDDLVIEERHPHLERVRHRRPVEVVEHVVHESQLLEEEQRRRKWVAVAPAESFRHDLAPGRLR